MNKKCFCCEHWRHTSKLNGSNHGRCHRFPPQIIQTTKPLELPGIFPLTVSNSSCGEFTPKKTNNELTGHPIRELYLLPGIQTRLLKNGIQTVDDLTKCSSDDLLEIRGIGSMKMKEIREKLGAFDLKLEPN